MTNEQLSLQTKVAFDAICDDSVESIINLKEMQQITLAELKKRNNPSKVRYKLGARLPKSECNGASEEVWQHNLLNQQ